MCIMYSLSKEITKIYCTIMAIYHLLYSATFLYKKVFTSFVKVLYAYAYIIIKCGIIAVYFVQITSITFNQAFIDCPGQKFARNPRATPVPASSQFHVTKFR